MTTRYDLVSQDKWAYLSPPLRGLNADLASVEAGGGGSGGGGGGGPIAFDTAARKPNGALLAGDLLDSGHVYTVHENTPNAGYVWTDGTLVHNVRAATVSAAYAATQLPGRVGRLWVDFMFTDTDSENVVLIVSGENVPFTNGAFSNAAAHIGITPHLVEWGVLTRSPWGIDLVADEWYDTPLPFNVPLTLAIDFDGDTGTMTTPVGSRITRTDARFATDSYRGPYACVESYSGSADKTQSKILSWGAAQEAPAGARVFSPVRESVLTPPDETGGMFAMDFRPAAWTEIVVPESPANVHADFNLPVMIPSSGKMLVTVQMNLVQTTGTYLCGLTGTNVTGAGYAFQRTCVGPWNGPFQLEWLWVSPNPGTAAVLHVNHFVIDGGDAHVKFDNGQGFFGVLKATPVL